MICLYLGSRISVRKVFVLQTKLWIPPHRDKDAETQRQRVRDRETETKDRDRKMKTEIEGMNSIYLSGSVSE